MAHFNKYINFWQTGNEIKPKISFGTPTPVVEKIDLDEIKKETIEIPEEVIDIAIEETATEPEALTDEEVIETIIENQGDELDAEVIVEENTETIGEVEPIIEEVVTPPTTEGIVVEEHYDIDGPIEMSPAEVPIMEEPIPTEEVVEEAKPKRGRKKKVETVEETTEETAE